MSRGSLTTGNTRTTRGLSLMDHNTHTRSHHGWPRFIGSQSQITWVRLPTKSMEEVEKENLLLGFRDSSGTGLLNIHRD